MVDTKDTPIYALSRENVKNFGFKMIGLKELNDKQIQKYIWKILRWILVELKVEFLWLGW